MAMVGAVISAASSILSGIAGMTQAKYQAAIARNNAVIANQSAKIANRNAVGAYEQGQIEAMDTDRQTATVLGEQKSAQAASGLALSSRSSALLRRSAKIAGRTDTLRVVSAAKQASDNFRTQAWTYKMQRANFQMEADAADKSAMFSMIGGLLGGASSIVGGFSNSSFVSSAQTTPFASRFIPKPVSKPTYLSRIVGPAAYGSTGW